MNKAPEASSTGLSRRCVLKTAVCAAGTVPILGMALSPTSAMAAKASQASVKYQPTPRGDQDCSSCRSFEPPNACKTVADEISPKGWCVIWIKK